MHALLILSLIPAAIGQSVLHPKPCCSPKQWSCDLSENGGQIVSGNPFQNTDKMYMDYDAKKIRLDRAYVGTDGQNETLSTVMDYSMQKTFYVDEKSCFSSDLQGEMDDPCIKNATYGGRRVIGSAGNNLDADLWMFSAHNQTYTLAVTTDGCVPVYQVITNLGYLSQRIYTYGNLTYGVPDGIFTLPSACHT